jgi:hypothetical protein
MKRTENIGAAEGRAIHEAANAVHLFTGATTGDHIMTFRLADVSS